MQAPDIPSTNDHHSLAFDRRRVTDDVTRMFHWLFSLSFFGAYVSADNDSLLRVHKGLGYLMLMLLAFRIVWGVMGPRRARLTSIWQRIKNIGNWIDTQKTDNHIWQMNWQTPQNALLALSIAMLLLTTVPLVLSGYLTENSIAANLFEELHEFFGDFYLLLVIVHVLAIVMVSLWRQRNLARTMVTGYVADKGPDLVKHNHTWVAALLLAGSVSWVLYYVIR